MKKIKARVKEIDNLVVGFESNTNDLSNDIRTFEKDMEHLEDMKVVNHPCEKIRELLEKWNAEDIATDDDLAKFAVSVFLLINIFRMNCGCLYKSSKRN